MEAGRKIYKSGCINIQYIMHGIYENCIDFVNMHYAYSERRQVLGLCSGNYKNLTCLPGWKRIYLIQQRKLGILIVRI